ncbi:hypothetical protein QAD02_010951 [Eretmocerus hayati]|uniref:Uncharacterized protein n=1 Tax=Eretmocerus hayati TaxID=131215 RepID=A0ACC2P050_9HYME|nr:hypothetical protein QAD02_010951 [Eretmocerus hayati]
MNKSQRLPKEDIKEHDVSAFRVRRGRSDREDKSLTTNPPMTIACTKTCRVRKTREASLKIEDLLNDQKNNDSDVHRESDEKSPTDSDESRKTNYGFEFLFGSGGIDSSPCGGFLDTQDLLNNIKNNDSKVHRVSVQSSSPDSDESLKNKNKPENLSGHEAHDPSSGEGSLIIQDSLNDPKSHDLEVHDNLHQKFPTDSGESLKDAHNSDNLNGYEAEGSSPGGGLLENQDSMNGCSNNYSGAYGKSNQYLPTHSDESLENAHKSENLKGYEAEGSSLGERLLENQNLLNDHSL